MTRGYSSRFHLPLDATGESPKFGADIWQRSGRPINSLKWHPVASARLEIGNVCCHHIAETITQTIGTVLTAMPSRPIRIPSTMCPSLALL